MPRNTSKSSEYIIPTFEESFVAEPMPAYTVYPREKIAPCLRLYEDEYEEVEEITHEELMRRLKNLPEVEYSPKVVARWEKEAKEAWAQLAAGKRKTFKSVKELVADLESD